MTGDDCLPRHVAGLVACDENVRDGREDEGVGLSVGETAQSVGGCGGEMSPLQASLHGCQRILNTNDLTS